MVIHALARHASTMLAQSWLDLLIARIGPGFHFETDGTDYVDADGRPLLTPRSVANLGRGLSRARAVLGDERFEDYCLRRVWHGLGVRYDQWLDVLVPVV